MNKPAIAMRGVGHAAHFLERLDRVPRAIVDEALALYRDTERVQWILGHAHLPQGTGRVALSLGDAVRGPFLVVTRDGAFVTCLGEGMSTGDLPIVTRGQIDAYNTRLDQRRERENLAREITRESGHEATDILRLVHTRADDLSREEFLAMTAWQPFLGADFVNELVGAAVDLEKSWPTLARWHEWHDDGNKGDALLHQYWRRLHSLGHLALLAGMGERAWLEKIADITVAQLGDPLPSLVTRQRHIGVALRGAWLAAREGKTGIARNAPRLASDNWLDVIDAALAVTAIGARHARLRDDALRTLRASVAAGDLADAHALVCKTGELVLDQPDEAARRIRRIGAATAHVFARTAPEDSPYFIRSVEDVTDDVADLAFLNHIDADLGRAVEDLSLDVLAVAIIARREAQDFYMPSAMRRDVTVPYMRLRPLRFLEDVAPREVIEPARRTTPKVGRNDPCGCGSGKKHKRCCGA